MAEVMIKCPRTGKYLSVGIRMDRASFESSRFEGNSVSCPHCGEMHVWGTKECHLIEEQAPRVG